MGGKLIQTVKVNITGKKIDSSFCLLSCIELLAQHFDVKCDGIYSSCSTFLIKSLVKKEIPMLRLPFAASPVELAKKYHSFELLPVILPDGCTKGTLGDVLIKKLPFITFVDSYICSWLPFYHKFHISHYITINGFDENGDLLCLDPFLSNKQYCLDIKEYYKYCVQDTIQDEGYKFDRIYEFHVTDNRDKDILGELIDTSQYILDHNMNEEIKNYFEFISDIRIFLGEFSQSDIIFQEGIIDLHSVVCTRKDYLRALKYSYGINQQSTMIDIIKDYTELVSCWEYVITKIFLSLSLTNEVRKMKTLSNVLLKTSKILKLEIDLTNRIIDLKRIQ